MSSLAADEPVEAVDEVLIPDNCAASCVTCGNPENTWPITSSISCLVGAGCVVLPDEDFDEVLDRVKSKEAEPVVAPLEPRAGAR